MVGERIERSSRVIRGQTAFEKGGDAYGTDWTFSISGERAYCCDRRDRRSIEKSEPAVQEMSNVRACSQIPPGPLSFREMTRSPLYLHLTEN